MNSVQGDYLGIILKFTLFLFLNVWKCPVVAGGSHRRLSFEFPRTESHWLD